MWRLRLYFFSKYVKYIGIVALVLSFFSDSIIFVLLGLFGLAAFIEVALTFSTLKCAILQMIGIIKVKKRYGKDIPGLDNYRSCIQYDLPFEGVWTVVNGCFTKEFSHSWGVPTQRYAYDFIMLDESGKSYTDNPKHLENYCCYNKEILSPADGIVIEVLEHEDETIILGKGRFFNRAKHIAGNYIVIKHSDNEYSTLAHLKDNSIVVRVGDRVLKGQKIASCGNTGNSSEPHLHFQLQDGPSFYDSAGLPIKFCNIKLETPLKYKNSDPRPNMESSKIPEGYITRGYNVSNN
ncbi:MAG: M23 family metallopeptidase [Dethiosulfatibacter sp.]|nr:M23 family metallopeptidase [Dethiosulfatibacter sp.]